VSAPRLPDDVRAQIIRALDACLGPNVAELSRELSAHWLAGQGYDASVWPKGARPCPEAQFRPSAVVQPDGTLWVSVWCPLSVVYVRVEPVAAPAPVYEVTP